QLAQRRRKRRKRLQYPGLLRRAAEERDELTPLAVEHRGLPPLCVISVSHADIYPARSPTNRPGGENATTPAGPRPVDRISWNPSARQGVLSIRHWAVRRKEKVLCQY